MRMVLQALRSLSMTLWVGGIAFFAFVLAPIAFSRLPSTRLAGIVVGGTLISLHRIGLVCGVLFLIATVVLQVLMKEEDDFPKLVQMGLVFVMLMATAYSHFHILPVMEKDRQVASGDIESAPRDNPGRLDFEKQHALSEKIEGVVLFCGVGVVLLMYHQPSTRSTAM